MSRNAHVQQIFQDYNQSGAGLQGIEGMQWQIGFSLNVDHT